MFDLAAAKARNNIAVPDNSFDALINVGLNTALAIAEKYCDRTFMQATETAKYYDTLSSEIMLPRYPITTLISMSEDGKSIDAGSFKVHGTGGYIDFFNQRYFKELDITYTGGYTVLPADLELALWMIFDIIWAQLPGGGATAGAVSASSVVKSINVPDVGTVQFDTSASATSGAGGANQFLNGTIISLINPYRQVSA